MIRKHRIFKEFGNSQSNVSKSLIIMFMIFLISLFYSSCELVGTSELVKCVNDNDLYSNMSCQEVNRLIFELSANVQTTFSYTMPSIKTQNPNTGAVETVQLSDPLIVTVAGLHFSTFLTFYEELTFLTFLNSLHF